jgi:hypothetical protein
MDEQLQPQNGGAQRRTLIVPAAFVAALVGGGVVGTVLGGPSVSSALQGDETTTTTADDEATDTTSGSTAGTDEVAPDRGECGPGGRGFGHFADLAVAADALGLTEDELRAALSDGSSLADVAEEQGVDVQTVIDALVAAATAELDERVATGDLDEGRAAEIEADLVDRITAKVNSERGFGPGFDHPGGPGGPRPGTPPDDASTDHGSTDNASTDDAS